MVSCMVKCGGFLDFKVDSEKSCELGDENIEATGPSFRVW